MVRCTKLNVLRRLYPIPIFEYETVLGYLNRPGGYLHKVPNVLRDYVMGQVTFKNLA